MARRIGHSTLGARSRRAVYRKCLSCHPAPSSLIFAWRAQVRDVFKHPVTSYGDTSCMAASDVGYSTMLDTL